MPCLVYPFVLALFLSACVDTVPLADAKCPCLKGYYCANGGVCKNEADLVSGMVGRKYIVAISSGQWSQPPGFAGALDDHHDYSQVYPVFAFEVEQVDPSSMTFTALLGTAKDGVQDTRNRTYRMNGSLTNGGDDGIDFVLGPADIQSIIFGPTTNRLASFYGLTLTGRFVGQGRMVDHGSLEAVMKASEIYNLFYKPPSTSGEDLCGFFATYVQYDCKACPFDPSISLCLTFEADDLSFPIASNLVFAEVASFDGESI